MQKRNLLKAAGFFALGALLSSCGDDREKRHSPSTESEMYPWAWSEEFQADLSIALAHNKISGCGQFEHRRHYQGDEYLVACTRDGERWTGYIVFPVIKKVVGPVGLENPPIGMSRR